MNPGAGATGRAGVMDSGVAVAGKTTAARVLLVDDATGVTELFADLVRQRLGWEVDVVDRAGGVTHASVAAADYDLAVVDLSFPGEPTNGLDVLLTVHAASPATALVVLTQGDDWVADLLRVAWEALPLATAMSKSSPLDQQIGRLDAVLGGVPVPPDPVLQPWLPLERSPWRSAAGFARLVPHVGHAKLWRALIESPDEPTYRDLAARTGLRMNTLKNYRSQLAGELALHGIDDPTIREMHAFAHRCRPLLQPHIAQRFGEPS